MTPRWKVYRSEITGRWVATDWRLHLDLFDTQERAFAYADHMARQGVAA